MFARVAARAVPFRSLAGTPRLQRISPSTPWSRTFASNERPPSKDNTWKPSDPIKFANGKTAAEPGTTATETKSQASPTSAKPDQQSTVSEPESDARSQEAQQSQKPLPDLRQGIPSTFAAEYAKSGASQEQDGPDVNDSFSGNTGGREGGDLPKSAYETSTDRRRNRVANWSYLVFLLFGTTGAVYMGRNWESQEEENAHADAPNGWAPGQIYARAIARINGQKAYYTEPTFQKLLPDKDKVPGGVPELTLVLSLEDLLLHSEWSTQHGYRLAKRPGLDYFLRYLYGQFELVIFTSVKSMDADPIIRKLDPFRLVMWPLFREATRFENGEYIKDLSYLNRDLSKVIVIDTNPSHVKLHPENAIVLPKWKGDPTDKGLVGMIPFLEYLAMMSQTGQPVDVRQVLKSMEGKDIASEYARREAKLRDQYTRDLAEQKRKSKSSAGGMFMKSLGLDAPKQGIVLGDQNISQGLAEGKMMIDMFREYNRQNFKQLDTQIREHGDEWLKEMAEEEKKMQEAQLKDMKAGAFGWLGAGAAPQSATVPPAASAASSVGSTPQAK